MLAPAQESVHHRAMLLRDVQIMEHEPLPTQSGMSFYRNVLAKSPLYRPVINEADTRYLSRLYIFSAKALQLSDVKDLGPNYSLLRREMAVGMVAAYHGIGEIADVYETAKQHNVGFDTFNRRVRSYLNGYYRIVTSDMFLHPNVDLVMQQLRQHNLGTQE